MLLERRIVVVRVRDEFDLLTPFLIAFDLHRVPLIFRYLCRVGQSLTRLCIRSLTSPVHDYACHDQPMTQGHELTSAFLARPCV